MLRASPGEGSGIARPPARIANGDFEQGLKAWHVVSGKAFARQPVAAETVRSDDVEIDGKPLVGLGGDFWHTPYPVGHHGGHLVRVVTRSPGILDSSRFSVGRRFLAYRLGGSAGGGVAIELRIAATDAAAVGARPLDKPDADGDVAVRIAAPGGSEVMEEAAWNLAPRAGPSLVGLTAKVRLRVDGRTKRPQRLLVDHLRLAAKRPPPFRAPLWGWADIHCHPMAQAGFGDTLAGHMHGPVEDLGSCLPLHGAEHGNLLRPIGFATGHHRHNDGSLATSGWTTGTPAPDDQLSFRAWPSFDDLSHIKTHQAWIRRAYEGGQRLMVALVVHNEMLSMLSTASAGQRDRDTVEPQVRMLREFVAHNADWCGLALKPDDARDLIAQNKMAFVLGLETDSINGWVRFDDFSEDATEANELAIHKAIHDYFGYLRDLGIVQVNLLHLTDNAFGGMAVYDFMFLVSSLQRSGRLPDTLPWAGADQDELIARPVSVGSELWDLLAGTVAGLGITIPAPAALGTWGIGDRNARGLTVAGKVALVEAMRLGMVIDTDHMSDLSEADAFAIATTTVEGDPYPLVAAHNGARFLAPRPLSDASAPVAGSRRNKATWPSEGMKSKTELEHIRLTEGIFGQGIAGTDSRSFGSVPNTCPGSSRTVAQGLEYVYSQLKTPVALGTDWNALLGGPGPRFGPRAANGLEGEVDLGDDTWKHAIRAERWDDAMAQDAGVHYDRPIRDWRSYRFVASPLFADRAAPAEGHLLWQALALLASGDDPAAPSVADALRVEGSTEVPVIELALGLSGRPGTAGSDYHRAGVVAANLALDPMVENPHVAGLATLLREIRPVWDRMPTGNVPELHRDTVGPMRDFDYNIDGLAHYGLLPDMLQDLRNLKMDQTVLDALFASAEHYVAVWEHSRRVAARIPH